MALPYACGCAIAGTAIRATSRPISPSGLNTVSGFFDQFARLRRWRRHCGRRERTSVRPLALGLAALNTHQTDKKALLCPISLRSIRAYQSPYFASAQYGLISRPISLTLNTGSMAPAMCSGWGPCAHTPTLPCYVLGLGPLRAYARLFWHSRAPFKSSCRSIKP